MGRGNPPLFIMGVDDQPNIYSNILIDMNPGTSGGFQFKRFYECSRCHLGFRENEITLFKGKVFGVPCGCSKDIAKLSSGGK